jgi:hypothetical protein
MTSPLNVPQLRVGRAGFDVPLNNIVTWEAGQRQLRVTGKIGYTRQIRAVEDAVTGRQQILALAGDLDEQVVPVRYSANAAMDGYYRVLSSSVPLDATNEAPLTNGVWPFELTLEQVPGSVTPIVESTCLGVVRANDHSLTAGIAWHTWPGNAFEGWTDNGNINGTWSRIAEDGVVTIAANSASGSLTYRPRCWLAAADYYQGAATLQTTGAGDTDTSLRRTVIGRQSPITPTRWRLHNGLIAVTPSATAGQIDVRVFDGTIWETAKTYSFNATAGGAINGFQSVTPLWVGPDRVAIRLGTTIGFGRYWGRLWIDLSVSRGDRWVRGILTTDRSDNWGVWSETSPKAATAITGGIRGTSNDAGGNRYILASSRAQTNDLTNGRLVSTALIGGHSVGVVKAFDFGIGVELGGSTAVDFPETAPNQVLQYMFAQHERQSVVAR